MRLTIILLISCIFYNVSAACTSDADCQDPKLPYCRGDQVCGQVASRGQFCQKPTDCASYAIFGDSACSASCDVDAKCGPFGDLKASSCCLGQNSQSACSVYREQSKVYACALGLQCLSTNSQCGVKESNKWVIGVIISICASIALNLGLNVQKYAFRKNELVALAQRKPAFKLPLWIGGFIIWIVGNIGNFVALSFAAQSLIASLGAISLVCNGIFAPLINKEPFGYFDLISILFIAAGTIIIVFFSNHADSELSLCTLISYYTRNSVILYLCITIAIICSLWFYIRYSSKTSQSKLNTVFLPFAYACIGGTLGGLTVLFAKSTAELITNSAHFLQYQTYLILLGIIITGAGQIYYINAGLRRYDALLQIPSFYVIYTLCGIASGAIYFGDFLYFTQLQLIMFAVGVTLTFIGVIFLAGRIRKPAPIHPSLEAQPYDQLASPIASPIRSAKDK